MIKDRLIEVDAAEALALAGKGEKVRCVGDGTGLMEIMGALEGLTFFVSESALTEKPKPTQIYVTPPKKCPPAASYDTPESRTRALIESVERYDEEHEAERMTKQKALAKEFGGGEEVPAAPAPFAGAPTGGALK